MDLEKAFDKVPHYRLLQKLQSFNVNNNVTEWMRSFKARTLPVKINNTFSSWLAVLRCILQRSIFGPLLFIIFINDLPE